MRSRYRTPPYVYRVYDADGLIYIGSTHRLWRRLEEHRRDTWWAETAVNVRATLHPTIEEARSAEARAILDEVPRWNLGDLRPRLRYFDRDQWDDFLQRFAEARQREIEWRARKGLWELPGLEPRAPFGLEWLVQRYRFHFGEHYDRKRLVKAA